MAQSNLAIFDLDNTLLDGDCEMLWSHFLRERRIVDDRFLARIDAYYLDYEQGNLDIEAYEAFLLSPLRSMPTARLLRLREDFVNQLSRRYRPEMIARVNRHRGAGDELLLLTASNHLLAEPVARYLGFEGVICTRVTQKIPSLAWGIQGQPAFQQGKVLLLQTWLGNQQKSLQGSWGYSDSHNDIPLLSLVDHPVAVTPDETLRGYADQHNWEIVAVSNDGHL